MFKTSTLLLTLASLSACGGRNHTNLQSGGAANASSGGTAQNSGGTTSSGANATTSGGTSAGGSIANGGATNAGGTAGSAHEQGGANANGGVNADAGAVAVGGDTALAGASELGGSAGIGAGGGAGMSGCSPPTVILSGSDAVAGSLIEFNDDGGWSWFQDERVIVDTAKNKLVVGSVANGGARAGNVEAVIYDLATGAKSSPAVLGTLNPDEHDAAAFAVRPDGKYLAMWAGHRQECNSYTSIYDGTAWSSQKIFDWQPLGCPWGDIGSNMVSYSNPWYLAAEHRFYSAARSVDTCPSLLVSDDGGESFSYYGRLISPPTVGFIAGYYKYWGNGSDRIDFVGTEGHPRDVDSNLWHGYLKGGKLFGSTGTVVDDDAGDQNTRQLYAFTQVFETGTALGGVKLSHAWIADLVRYADGTIALIWTARADTTADSNNPDLRLAYARFDGSSWQLSYLSKAGPKLFADEQDYTGLGALDPDDPRTLYISTSVDPRDDQTPLGKHELWRGTTCDEGATFTWTPVTQNSTSDNLRPVVPKWDAHHSALLWLRGLYTTSQKYDQRVVGLISSR